MINFFRKIRKKLADDNKPLKYMRYAIGEIVLVVIGIMIALSINNWNSQQIEIKKLKGDLLYVIQDIRKDKKQLIQLKEQRLEVVGYTTEFIESYLYSKPITFVDPIENFRRIIEDIIFINNDNGFKRVNSSKIFESIKYEAISNKMSEYSAAVEYIRFQENNQNSFTEQMEGELFKNGFYSKIYPYMRASFTKGKFAYPQQKLDLGALIKNNEEAKAIFSRYEITMAWIVSLYDDLIRQGEELILEIEEFLVQE
jgi:hypothetical protein